MKRRGKKAALELSIGTMVIIVLAVTMLILGLVLVRNIFGIATDSITDLGDKTKDAIAALFTDESTDVMVKLGTENTAKIRPSSETFGIAIAARTTDGTATDRERLEYTLTLSPTTGSDCVAVYGEAQTRSLFITQLDTPLNFDAYDDDKAFALVEVLIPEGTPRCTQKVLIDVVDTQTGNPVGGNFFKFEVLRSGLF